jgi:heptosyltransferase-2
MKHTSFPKRTLVVQPLPGIGDMVWFVSYLRALAAQSPDKKISLLAKPSSQVDRLLGHEGFIDEILWLEPGKSILELLPVLKQYNYTQIWILHHSPKFALLAFLAGIPQRYGYGFSWQKFFLTSKNILSKKLKMAHTILKARQFLSQHQIMVQTKDQYLTVDLKAQKSVEESFKVYPRPWICLGIGATQASRRWPNEAFSELVALLNKSGGNTVFLSGGPPEAAAALEIQSGVPKQHKKAIPVTHLPLEQTAALIKMCNFFVGNDSGLMNISACLGIPTVGLFGQGFTLDYTSNLLAVTPLKMPARIEDIQVSQVIELLKSRNLIE